MENPQPSTQLRGLYALQSALRDRSVPIFRVSWTGRLTPVSREEAAAIAARGSSNVLLVELT